MCVCFSFSNCWIFFPKSSFLWFLMIFLKLKISCSSCFFSASRMFIFSSISFTEELTSLVFKVDWLELLFIPTGRFRLEKSDLVCTILLVHIQCFKSCSFFAESNDPPKSFLTNFELIFSPRSWLCELPKGLLKFFSASLDIVVFMTVVPVLALPFSFLMKSSFRSFFEVED